jgi:hypothetical protein
MLFFAQKLADCWWQIPPFGKDFRFVSKGKIALLAEVCCFLRYGTGLEWFQAGLGPYELEFGVTE